MFDSNQSSKSAAKVDVLLLGGQVLTLNNQQHTFNPGAVAIRGDRIAAVGPRPEIETHYQSTQVLDYTGDIIMPGLINAHTHAAMTCFRGLADDLPLAEWLNDYIFPAERQIDRDLVYWGTKLAMAEMLLSGTTTFCDMYLFADAVAQAATEAGMRAVIGEVLYDFPSSNYGPPENGLRFSEDLCLRWKADPLIRVAIQPHAIYTCSPELLVRCGELAARHEVRLIIHLAETWQEVKDCQARYGATPVGHLHRLGLLDSRLVADHAVALSAADVELMAQHGASVVHCPESNMKLASGIAPVVELLAQGVKVGLGTDGCASNNDLDLLQEMDTTAKLHKVHHFDPTVLPASAVLELATRGSAGVLDLDQELGSLEPGKRADVIVIDCQQPHMIPMYNPCSHLVYVATGADVRTVLVNGRVLVRDRQVLTFEVEEAMAQVRQIARRLKAPYTESWKGYCNSNAGR
ncbi:MAG: S-adenosylhomocysteine deaminase [Desulfobacca sp. 4484_104]|nr:MAG: S-adenosylhomocysteine deaminase [Desulfobacca sp. 4484_104]RLA90887.1 MAG: S-adenosylhomocysteine deaminase [Deltaproteobacteria bacterium]